MLRILFHSERDAVQVRRIADLSREDRFCAFEADDLLEVEEMFTASSSTKFSFVLLEAATDVNPDDFTVCFQSDRVKETGSRTQVGTGSPS